MSGRPPIPLPFIYHTHILYSNVSCERWWFVIYSYDGSEQFVFFLVVLCREFVRHSDRKCPLYTYSREMGIKGGSHLNISFFSPFFPIFMIFSTMFPFFQIHYMGWAVMNSVRDFHQYLNSKGCTFPFSCFWYIRMWIFDFHLFNYCYLLLSFDFQQIQLTHTLTKENES